MQIGNQSSVNCAKTVNHKLLRGLGLGTLGGITHFSGMTLSSPPEIQEVGT